jgi:hypothetical protein
MARAGSCKTRREKGLLAAVATGDWLENVLVGLKAAWIPPARLDDADPLESSHWLRETKANHFLIV